MKRIIAALAVTIAASSALLGGALPVSAAAPPTRAPSWCEWCGLSGTSNGKSWYNIQAGHSRGFQVSYRNTGDVSELADVYTTGSYASVSRAHIYLRAPRLGPARIHCTVTITVPKDAHAGIVTDSVTAQVPGFSVSLTVPRLLSVSRLTSRPPPRPPGCPPTC